MHEAKIKVVFQLSNIYKITVFNTAIGIQLVYNPQTVDFILLYYSLKLSSFWFTFYNKVYAIYSKIKILQILSSLHVNFKEGFGKI